MNTTVNADSAEFWNGVGAEKWLRFQDKMHTNLLPFGHEAMEAASISNDQMVLDIGCGCGDTSFEIGRRVTANGHVHGLDISNPFVTEARRRKASDDVKNVSFGCSDAQIHLFESGFYDVVFSRFGVMFFDDPVQAFRNIRNAMKPGGRLAFICWQPAADNEWVSVSLDIVAKHIPLPEPLGPEEPGPMSLGDVDRTKRILNDAGFSEIRIKGSNTPFRIGADIGEAIDFLTQLGPAGGAVFRSGADDKVISKIATDLHHGLVPFLSPGGVRMGAATWIVTAKK